MKFCGSLVFSSDFVLAEEIIAIVRSFQILSLLLFSVSTLRTVGATFLRVDGESLRCGLRDVTLQDSDGTSRRWWHQHQDIQVHTPTNTTSSSAGVPSRKRTKAVGMKEGTSLQNFKFPGKNFRGVVIHTSFRNFVLADNLITNIFPKFWSKLTP